MDYTRRVSSMKRFLAVILTSTLLLANIASVSAAPPTVTGTISVATPVPTYQQVIDFDWSVIGKYKGYQYPMIVVSCYQAGELVYRQLDHPDSTQLILGGGWSLWVGRGGGDADCDAGLYLYPGLHSGPIVLLATTPTFHAEG